MRVHHIWIVSIGLSLAPLSPALADSCFSASETRALLFRTWQQEFSIAALYCHELFPESTIKPHYQTFVIRFNRKLEQNASKLRQAFDRVGLDMDRWMTQVANHASDRVFHDPDFCVRADQELDQALDLRDADLDLLAEASAGLRYPVNVCEAAQDQMEIYRR